MSAVALNLDQVRAVVGAALGGAAGPVFVAGSSVDGLANAQSDVDVYTVGTAVVAGSETAARRYERTATIDYLDGRELNLTVLDPAGITGLGRTFRAAVDSLTAPRGIAQLLTDDDVKVLHRIRTGVALDRPDLLAALRAELGTDDLARYLLNVAAVAAVNRLTDVAGERAAGQHESAAWMFREALVHAGQCVLAATGETNPVGKWLLRLLRRQPPSPAPAAARLGELCARLLLAPTDDLPADLVRLATALGGLLDRCAAELGPYVRTVARPKLG